MKNWNKKTPAEIRQLCEQIREVIISDEAFSISVFGKKAALFFKDMDIESIDPDAIKE